MDERIILQKLESLARCIERLKSKKPSDIETFRTDHDLQDISEKNLPYRRQVMYVVFFRDLPGKNDRSSVEFD